MKEDIIVRICPKCGKHYRDTPALSREDGETLICPECGTREALESAGLDNAEQEQILNAIERERSELLNLVQCGERTYYFDNPAKIGVFKLSYGTDMTVFR